MTNKCFHILYLLLHLVAQFAHTYVLVHMYASICTLLHLKQILLSNLSLMNLLHDYNYISVANQRACLCLVKVVCAKEVYLQTKTFILSYSS